MQTIQPFIVYRDRIGVPSEIAFLRRQYIGFTRLGPIWTGRTLLAGAPQLGEHCLRLGGNGLLGPLHRFAFRHLRRVPPVALPGGIPLLHAQFARGGALALPLAVALGVPMVVTLHGGDISKERNWRGTVLARRWAAVVRQAARFVCVSAAVAEAASDRGVPDGKLTVLPIGVEIPERLPPRRPLAHLFVGRFVEKKGITILADAMRRLRALDDQTPLVCVGDGPMRPVLQAMARDVTGITLTGWLSPAAVQRRMEEAVSLVVPSITARNGDAEGLPSVIPEAMARACPIIGSAEGGIAEAIRQERTGLLVQAGNAAALATAMHRMTREPGLADRLGMAGFSAASTELNARLQSEKLEKLLLSVCPAAQV